MKTEYEQYIKDAEAEIIRLRADNEQLRKALELAVEDVAARFISSNTTIADYIDMAKQALGEKP